jgi:hypothetical protein
MTRYAAAARTYNILAQYTDKDDDGEVRERVGEWDDPIGVPQNEKGVPASAGTPFFDGLAAYVRGFRFSGS